MFFSKHKRRVTLLPGPNVGILDLGGPDTAGLVAADAAFLTPIFGTVETKSLAALECDVLFLYANLAADGSIVGSSRGLREIIRDSGASVVVVASANPSESYVKAGKQRPYGRANLVMTLDRCGEAFGLFFTALFSRMKSGISMPTAWIELNPQVTDHGRPNCPETIFACEIGPLAFAKCGAK